LRKGVACDYPSPVKVEAIAPCLKGGVGVNGGEMRVRRSRSCPNLSPSTAVVRRPNEAMFVKPYGVVGQVEPVLCNIRNDASVRQVMQGADAVVNCVGILVKSGKNTFDAVQSEGPERIARIAASEGITRMVQISAIGADMEADSDYARTKAEGEAAVLKHMPNAMILRPSIVFGPEDQFFNRFAGMTRLSPVIPVAGGATKFGRSGG